MTFKLKTICFTLGLLLVTATAALAEFGESINDRPPVGLLLLDKLMSGRSHVGDIVHYETLANVCDRNGNVLIPAGSPAFGTVTRSKGSGMFGKRGQLEFTCDHVDLPNGEHVPLTGSSIGGSGANGTAATVAVSLLVSPLGLLIKGGTITVNKGTPVTMYIADGARIDPATGAPVGVRADFTLRDKNAGDITGSATSFDGSAYSIKSDSGQDVTEPLSDIASISLNVAPLPN